MVRVKICGITNSEDASLAVEAGADAVGFIFCTSPRRVTVEEATEISMALPPFVTRVGVFANAAMNTVREVAQACGLDAVQLHGDESPEDCRRVGLKVIKAFRLRTEADLEPMAGYRVDAYLLDAHADGALGGTGQTFDWKLALKAKKYGPVILAGGLNPDLVGEAIRFVRPYGVDVSSGVEASPGRKDPEKVRCFISEALRAGSALSEFPEGCEPARSRAGGAR